MELIGIDVDKLDQEEKSIYDERTIKGRELKAAQVKFESLKRYPDVEGGEELKIGELSKKLQEAMQFNQSLSRRKEANDMLRQQGANLKANIADMEQQLVELKKKLADMKERHSTEREALLVLEPIDVGEINESISTIESINIKIRENNTYAVEKSNLQTIKEAYDTIDYNLECVRQNRLNLIQSANIPVPGLTFDEDGLLYHDIPLSQCSDGEKLMVSMGISMALNPTMRVVRIKDGSLLGKRNMAILETMCKDKDFQLWIERVSDRDSYEKGGKVGILIEEGQAEGDGVVEDTPKCDVPKPEPPKKRDKTESKPIEVKAKDDEW